jgi:hypothetical protein
MQDIVKLYRAKLNADGIYQGIEEVASLAAGDVEVPGDCDLAVGEYMWDGGTFIPMIVLRHAAELTQAIADGR